MRLDKTETFEVTEDHIKLLKRSNTSWTTTEYGAPMMDPKRPYGNSNVERDMAKILDREIFDPKTGDRIDDKAQDLYKIHKQMETVLQILFDNARSGIETGTYERQKYGGSWQKVE